MYKFLALLPFLSSSLSYQLQSFSAHTKHLHLLKELAAVMSFRVCRTILSGLQIKEFTISQFPVQSTHLALVALCMCALCIKISVLAPTLRPSKASFAAVCPL